MSNGYDHILSGIIIFSQYLRIFAIQMLKGLDFAYLNFDDERLLGISDYDDLLKAIRQVYGETKYVL